MYGLKVEDFSYSKISSIQYETEFLLASIDIQVTDDVVEIDGVGKSTMLNCFVKSKRFHVPSGTTFSE